ncbi:MAG: lipopolysaccharide heptosyltransferase II [Aridibacter sp.]
MATVGSFLNCLLLTAYCLLMKIIVRGTNWIGDAVMTIPALRQLRRIFPEAKIFLHTRSWAKGIFQDADFIDDILTFEKESNSLKTIKKQAKIWREQNFDLAILFTNSFQTALLAKLGKAEKRFGYKNEGRSFLLTNSFEKPVWKNEKHEIFYYLNLIAEVENTYFESKTVLEKEVDTFLKVSDERKTNARKILQENGIDSTKKTIALGVGSTNSRAKRWNAESYAELNDKLQSELNANVILIGSEDELNVSHEVFEKSEIKPIILTGETSLYEAVAILAEVDLLVSNDMGLAHVSSAVGTKTLTIFGPTNPLTTKPWNSEIIRQDVECSPCMLRDCPIDHRCMKWILPEEVFAKAIAVLDLN